MIDKFLIFWELIIFNHGTYPKQTANPLHPPQNQANFHQQPQKFCQKIHHRRRLTIPTSRRCPKNPLKPLRDAVCRKNQQTYRKKDERRNSWKIRRKNVNPPQQVIKNKKWIGGEGELVERKREAKKRAGVGNSPADRLEEEHPGHWKPLYGSILWGKL